MTREALLQKLRELKPKYEKEGFVILGLFGSCARDQATEASDVDILYKIRDIDEYLTRYSGWEAVNHIVEAKEALQKELHAEVDFVDADALNEVGRKYILSEVVHV